MARAEAKEEDDVVEVPHGVEVPPQNLRVGAKVVQKLLRVGEAPKIQKLVAGGKNLEGGVEF